MSKIIYLPKHTMLLDVESAYISTVIYNEGSKGLKGFKDEIEPYYSFTYGDKSSGSKLSNKSYDGAEEQWKVYAKIINDAKEKFYLS